MEYRYQKWLGQIMLNQTIIMEHLEQEAQAVMNPRAEEFKRQCEATRKILERELIP